MAMDKQTRLIMEKLAQIEAKLTSLDVLIAMLAPPALAEKDEAKAPAKPAKGIGENKS